MNRKLITLGMCTLIGCGEAGLPPAAQTTPTKVEVERIPQQAETPAPQKQAPPTGTAPREIHFPPIARETTGSGLEVNTVALHGVPAVQVKLVIKSGSARDPQALPGVAQMVAQMLKEGTAKRTSAVIAETVDFLGARLDIHSDAEQITINMRALADQLPEALTLVSELAMQPTFDEAELKKLKAREQDRLRLLGQNPNFLARREFWKSLYGAHPYARVDTTPEAVERVTRADLAAFHRKYFAPNNAYLVVVGDLSHDKVMENANKVFKTWQTQKQPAADYPAPPSRAAREIILVDRQDSVQSVIAVGNLALARKDPDYVPLLVANQVLGGSAASRMFMDLREKQSLTYGAYSSLDEGPIPVPFRASAAVRNEVTAQALKAFFQHLDRISTEPASATEIADAKRLLIDSFPLRIETPSAIAGLVSDLREYGFPDNYWDGFRAEIAAVTPERALEAAKRYIRPNSSVVVVVGRAAAVKEALSAYGPVRVIDMEGKLVAADPLPQPSAAGAPPAQTNKPATAVAPSTPKPQTQPPALPQPPAAAPPAVQRPQPSAATTPAPAPATPAQPASVAPKPELPKDAKQEN